MLFAPTKHDRHRAKKHKLKERGIAYPVRTVWAARQADLPLSYACALLEQESEGGKNVFGHDAVKNPIKSPAGGLKKVTLRSYLKYKKYRKQGLGMQGVGPCQLTWFATQDEADALGGCWRAAINMFVGFRTLKSNIRAHGLWAGAKAYNGTGDAATRYANLLTGKISQWQNRFKGDR